MQELLSLNHALTTARYIHKHTHTHMLTSVIQSPSCLILELQRQEIKFALN